MLTELLYTYLPQNPLLNTLSIIGIMAVISIIAFYITEKIILNLLTRMFRKTSTDFDDILMNRNVFNRLAYLVPALIFYNLAYAVPQIESIIQRTSLTLMALSGLLVINAFLSALSDIYDKTKYSERIHIKSYVQITKLIINILGIVVIVAVLIGKNPTWLISGLGAMTAVLLLIFKETILSLVASIQINSNNLFKIGDWIEGKIDCLRTWVLEFSTLIKRYGIIANYTENWCPIFYYYGAGNRSRSIISRIGDVEGYCVSAGFTGINGGGGHRFNGAIHIV